MNLPKGEQTITLSEGQAVITRRKPSHVENLDRSWPAGEHDVTLEFARELVARRRRIAMEAGGAFKKEALDRLLVQPGCAGVRIYHGVHNDGRPALVLVGVDERGEELVTGVLLEEHIPCPPFCGIGPSLKSQGI